MTRQYHWAIMPASVALLLATVDSTDPVKLQNLALRWLNIAMENGPLVDHLPIKMVMFHSYVDLPKDNGQVLSLPNSYYPHLLSSTQLLYTTKKQYYHYDQKPNHFSNTVSQVGPSVRRHIQIYIYHIYISISIDTYITIIYTCKYMHMIIYSSNV